MIKNSQGDVDKWYQYGFRFRILYDNDFISNTPGAKKLFSFDRIDNLQFEENTRFMVSEILHQKTSDVVAQAYLKVSENLNINK